MLSVWGTWQPRQIIDQVKEGPNNSPQPRISFGLTAERKHFPHLALISSYCEKYVGHCTGTLISENYVLTAAHCVNLRVNKTASLVPHIITIKLGSTNFNPDSSMMIHALIGHKNVIMHPGFVWYSSINDIALVKLPERVQPSEYIRPIKLASAYTVSKSFEGLIGNSSGWGSPMMFRAYSPYLRYGDVKIVSSKLCYDIFPKNATQKQFICSMSYRHPCIGDSGGPLEINGTQIGIAVASVTILGFCTLPAFTIYMPVGSYRKWISENSDVKFD